mmetsp:Transcript_3797/g.12665  ORF Transcript_3797/g.12665 Transcript_3797/m.12665 type:complete len:627 (-) Transcript_3797:273-2153(-)
MSKGQAGFLSGVSGDTRRYIREIKNKVYNYTEMEQMVREATCNEPTPPSAALMREIAKGTFTVEFPSIMAIIWKRIKDKSNENHPYKCLVLLEYVIREGNTDMVIKQINKNMPYVEQLKHFTLINDRQQDVGGKVRAKAESFIKFVRDGEPAPSEPGAAGPSSAARNYDPEPAPPPPEPTPQPNLLDMDSSGPSAPSASSVPDDPFATGGGGGQDSLDGFSVGPVSPAVASAPVVKLSGPAPAGRTRRDAANAARHTPSSGPIAPRRQSAERMGGSQAPPPDVFGGAPQGQGADDMLSGLGGLDLGAPAAGAGQASDPFGGGDMGDPFAQSTPAAPTPDPFAGGGAAAVPDPFAQGPAPTAPAPAGPALMSDPFGSSQPPAHLAPLAVYQPAEAGAVPASVSQESLQTASDRAKERTGKALGASAGLVNLDNICATSPAPAPGSARKGPGPAMSSMAKSKPAASGAAPAPGQQQAGNPGFGGMPGQQMGGGGMMGAGGMMGGAPNMSAGHPAPGGYSQPMMGMGQSMGGGQPMGGMRQSMGGMGGGMGHPMGGMGQPMGGMGHPMGGMGQPMAGMGQPMGGMGQPMGGMGQIGGMGQQNMGGQQPRYGMPPQAQQPGAGSNAGGLI